MSQNYRARKRGPLAAIFLLRVSRFLVAAYSCFQPLSVLRFYFFLTIEQRFDTPPALPFLVRIECLLDPTQHDMKRHAAFFPNFNQRPVDRAKQQVLAAPANKGVFDFSEVAEIVKARA